MRRYPRAKILEELRRIRIWAKGSEARREKLEETARYEAYLAKERAAIESIRNLNGS